MLLAARRIAKSHAMRPLFSDVSITVDVGERVGVIGANGAGKSTLLKVLAGDESPDDGVVDAAKGLRAVYVPQLDRFPDHATARMVVVRAAAGGDRAGTDRDDRRDIADVHDIPDLHDVQDLHDLHAAETIADNILGRMGFDDALAGAPTTSLSGGWRKRLSLARALARCGGEPDVLLLDEPTNHLDLDGIRLLEELLRRPRAGTRLASVFVTHDRTFLENVATRVVELGAAYPDGTLAVDGNYSEFVRRRDEFLAGQARAEQTLANRVRKDLAWLSRGPQARRTKARFRIDASMDRIDELAALKDRNSAAIGEGARVDFSASGRRTRRFIAAQGIAKTLGGRLLFKGVDCELGPGDRLGLLGANGSGKTTLIRVLTGELPPDAGTVKLADPTPRIVVFRQHRIEFAPATPLREALCPVGDQVRFRGEPMHVTSWSRRFLFHDDQLDQPVGALSGGELARVHIARIMLEPADVLVLDEPTNDLDIPTLQVLEEAIEAFPGAVVLVTHDRAMLERLATQVLAIHGGDGAARTYASLDHALAAERALAAQRDEAARAERTAASARTSREGAGVDASAAATGGPPPSRRRLGFRDQREYDGMADRILAAEAAAAAAESKVNDPAVAASHTRMADACRALDAAHAEVSALYARWAELEAKMG